MTATTGRRYLIDLHCDTISECHKRGIGLRADSLQLSLGRLPSGLGLCQVFAVFMPDEYRGVHAEEYFEAVYRVFRAQIRKNGVPQVCDAARVGEVLAENRVAAVLAVEGGSALCSRLERLDLLARRGVKLMTLTWNGENEICGGAATDLGFTDFGRQVVRRMEALRIAVDVSHLSDRGFWELCGFAERPFLASHSNSRAVCDHRRNLTDGMFREIVRRGGLVGLNYYKSFIAPEGNTASIQDLLRHLHHFLALGGEDVLALGSDFDGADMPPYLSGIERIGSLLEALASSGIPERVAHKITYENARRFLAETTGGEDLCTI